MRKPLTYGSASMHAKRNKNPVHWRERCWSLSEKPQAQFFEEKKDVFCEYLENGKIKIEKII